MNTSHQNAAATRNLLTIAIPTFQRREAVCKTVQSLLKESTNRLFDITIVVNGSGDGTYEELTKLYSGIEDLEIYHHEENKGFAKNFIRLFTECQTDYLLILSDEDEVDLSKLPKLIDFLNSQKPGFVSTDFYRGHDLFRGKKRDCILRLSEAESAAFYISGLLFNSKLAKKRLAALEKLTEINGFVSLYPQTFLAICLTLESKGFWYGSEVTFLREQLETSFSNGLSIQSPYWFTNSRIEQLLGWNQMIAWVQIEFKGVLTLRQKMWLKHSSMLRTYPVIIQSFGAQYVDLPRLFRRSQQAHFLYQAFIAKPHSLIKFAMRRIFPNL